MKQIKIIFNILEPLLLFFAFVVPSFITNSENILYINTKPNIYPILLRIIMILYLTIRLYDTGVFHKKKHKLSPSKVNNFIFSSIKIVLWLQTTAIICNMALTIIPHNQITLIAEPPNTLLTWVWFFTTLIILAIFEEILYRGYFPERILHSIRNYSWYRNVQKKQKIIIKLCIELSVIIIFALGHSYMGLKSIIISFFCGIILRIMVKLKRSLVQVSTAHIINNIISYMILFFVTN